MSKAVNNLRKLETQTYKEWWAHVRYVGECRNALIMAEGPDQKEKKAILTMATASADRTFNRWLQVCEALDEVELGNHRPPQRPNTQP